MIVKMIQILKLDKISFYKKMNMAAGFSGCIYSGFMVCNVLLLNLFLNSLFLFRKRQINHIDVASNYAGALMGVTNCLATVSVLTVPYVVNRIVTISVALIFKITLINLRLPNESLMFVMLPGVAVSVASGFLFGRNRLCRHKSSLHYSRCPFFLTKSM